jgi:glycosyltransferase involved in cell wall biosynthesis
MQKTKETPPIILDLQEERRAEDLVVIESKTETRTKAGLFTIFYAGSLYGERTAESFFKAMRTLFKWHPELRGKIKVVFAGTSQHQTEDYVEALGWISHKHCCQLMQEADLLLLLQSTAEAESGCIPGKLFEYAASGTRILAVMPNKGEAYERLNKLAFWRCIAPDPWDTEEIARCVLGSYSDWSRENEDKFCEFKELKVPWLK